MLNPLEMWVRWARLREDQGWLAVKRHQECAAVALISIVQIMPSV